MSSDNKDLPAETGEEEILDSVVIEDTDHKIDWLAPRPDNVETPAQRRRFEKQMKALAAFAAIGNLTGAARVAGVGIRTLHHWRTKDPWFRERFQEAEAVYRDQMHDLIHNRVTRGVEVPLMGKRANAEGSLEDEVIGYKTVYSDNLTMFLAKKVDHSWRDNYYAPQAEETQKGAVSVLDRIKARLNEKAARKVIDVTPDPDSDSGTPQLPPTADEDAP